MSDHFKNVVVIICDKLSIDEGKVHLHSHLLEDLGIDSLDAVECTMELEEKYQIEILPEVSDRFQTVQDVVDYLEKLKPSTAKKESKPDPLSQASVDYAYDGMESKSAYLYSDKAVAFRAGAGWAMRQTFAALIK